MKMNFHCFGAGYVPGKLLQVILCPRKTRVLESPGNIVKRRRPCCRQRSHRTNNRSPVPVPVSTSELHLGKYYTFLLAARLSVVIELVQFIVSDSLTAGPETVCLYYLKLVPFRDVCSKQGIFLTNGSLKGDMTTWLIL